MSEASEQDRKFQEQLRERINPEWRNQLQMHYRILGVRGPVGGEEAHKLFNRVKRKQKRR